MKELLLSSGYNCQDIELYKYFNSYAVSSIVDELTPNSSEDITLKIDESYMGNGVKDEEEL